MGAIVELEKSENEKICSCPSCNAPHPELFKCTGGADNPEGWRDFLWDQKQKRKVEERTQRRKLEDRESMDRARRRSDLEVD